MIKRIFLLLAVIQNVVLSQEEYQTKFLGIEFLPFYESWNTSGNSDFSEFTTILNVSYLPERNTEIFFSSRYATISGDVSELNGLSDIQLVANKRLRKYNLVLSGGINVPSGKTKLTTDEFLTSRLISQNIFNLRTSNLGQGLNVFLGATWTHPLTESIVIGAGLSYQVKSEYQPISLIPQKYQPSNEISLTAGFDSKINEISTISGDITAIFYGSDKVDGQEIFSTGNRLIFNTLYKRYIGFHVLSFMVLYRTIGIGKLEEKNPLIENEKINPNQFYLGSVFNHRISPNVRMNYGIALNIYEKTSAFYSGYTLYELSTSPEIKLSPTITIPTLLKYALGSAEGKSDLTNFEIGIGIRFSL